MRMRRVVASLVKAAGTVSVFAVVGTAQWAGAPPAAAAQPAEVALYRCVADTDLDVESVGLALCDAEPGPPLLERAEPDNLQVREGALVVAVEDGGVAAVAGVQAGDMIYRVAGDDVTEAAAAGTGLAGVRADSDTQINFLRRGRPYRIKLRR